MKVAVLYSGLVNITQDIYDNHRRHLIDIYDTDIYCSTWDTPGYDAISSIISSANLIEIENFDTAKSIFEELAFYLKTHAETRPINVMSMYYKLSRVYRIIRDKNYDIVVRQRFDTTFLHDIHLSQSDTIKIPKGQDHRDGINDRWAYGPQELMKKYHNVYKNIQTYCLAQKQIFHPEFLLKYHLNKEKAPIERTQDKINLRGVV